MKIQFQDGSSAEINSVPAGTILLHAGDTPPDGYLPCNGAIISRTTYAKLFAVLGTRYGAGDGNGTFGLPNVEDRFPRFAGNGLVIGEKQGDAQRNFKAEIWDTYGGLEVPPSLKYISASENIAYSPGNPNGRYNTSPSATNAGNPVVLDLSRTNPTADENRPKSIVVAAYIKY